jgi:MerR family transcriptional regulator, light-induced transcriptional regulator
MNDSAQTALATDRWGPESASAQKGHAGYAHQATVQAEEARRSSATLARIVRDEIVPRLVLAHLNGLDHARPRNETVARPGSDIADRLLALVLAPGAADPTSYVERLIEQGASVHSVLQDLLAPTATRIANLWSEDGCDLASVAAGAWRLHQILHALGPRFRGDAGGSGPHRRVLLTAALGEQRTFGVLAAFSVTMAAAFFRCAGWSASTGPVMSRAELLTRVREESFAVVGLTIGPGSRLHRLAADIRAVRRASRNSAVGILVIGDVFKRRTDLSHRVGADAMAADARGAPLQAARLVSLLATEADAV